MRKRGGGPVQRKEITVPANSFFRIFSVVTEQGDGSEEDMLDGFLLHLEKSNPDIFIAHALLWADLPKLVERLDVYRKGDKLSPVNQVIRKGKNG